MTQKTKSSTEGATSSSQRPDNPSKGMKNMGTNNTNTAHSATTEQKPETNQALFDLENTINDAKNMASILGRMLHDIFDKDHSAVTGHRDFYFIGEDNVSDMIFAASHLRRFIKSTLDTWNKALDHNTCAR